MTIRHTTPGLIQPVKQSFALTSTMVDYLPADAKTVIDHIESIGRAMFPYLTRESWLVTSVLVMSQGPSDQ